MAYLVKWWHYAAWPNAKTMKTVLFVPGFKGDRSSSSGSPLLPAIRAAGYKLRYVDIQWKRTVVDDWVRELEEVYKNYNPEDTILAGFSFGAVAALLAAAKRLPAGLWLFSLSSAFDDDRELKKPDADTLRWIGKRRLSAFAALDYHAIIQRITCKTLIFYGELEVEKYPDLVRRCQLAANDIPGARIIKIPRAGHAVDNPDYITAIRENI